MRLLVLIWMITGFFWASNAFCFPELVRHGYVNCSSCHYSPTGGGILTDYGRALSKEVLSKGMFFFEGAPGKSDGEEGFLNGHYSPPNWLRLGGDLRAIQIFQDTPTEVSGRFILMQADLEVVFQDTTNQRMRLVATLGRSDPAGKPADSLQNFLISRRHWISLMLGPQGDQIETYQIRFGRFYPAYGLNIADHTVVTRRSLGFDQEQETYNLEAAYLGDTYQAYLTAIFGRIDRPGLGREKGYALQVSRGIGESAKAGLNGYVQVPGPGSLPDQNRRMFGGYGIFSFTPKLYSLMEWDAVSRTNPATSAHWGFADYLKLGWEFDQGVHLFFSQEFYRQDLQTVLNSETYTLGLEYYPRTHWEFLVSLLKSRNTAVSSYFDNALYLLGHYYF